MIGWNDPDYVWTVFKRTDTGEILGPSIEASGPYYAHRVTYATLDDNGGWHEVPAEAHHDYMAKSGQ